VACKKVVNFISVVDEEFKGLSEWRMRNKQHECCYSLNLRIELEMEFAMLNTFVQHITSSPDVFSGKPCIAGHRIRVLDIVIWHEKRGLSPDEILGLFPTLTLGDVYAALAYYFDHREAIETDLRREAVTEHELKARYPSKLQAKLSG
jgi:uncharacterized protein (DUF433 family)